MRMCFLPIKSLGTVRTLQRQRPNATITCSGTTALWVNRSHSEIWIVWKENGEEFNIWKNIFRRSYFRPEKACIFSPFTAVSGRCSPKIRTSSKRLSGSSSPIAKKAFSRVRNIKCSPQKKRYGIGWAGYGFEALVSLGII